VGGENAEKVQDALYRIAELASAAQDMPEFYRAIHEVVGELMDAKNFYIALYDAERELINWPYHVDESGTYPDPNKWYPLGEGSGRGTTAFVLRTGEPQLITLERFAELAERGELDLVGPQSEEWLGVPLKTEERTVGVLVVQSYTKGVRYTEQDKELLAFVGQHVGVALSRARAIEETRQRNAELALINSVQDAIAGELDQQAIYDAVGDKIQEIFDAQGVCIAFLEPTGLVSFPYLVERGERLSAEPRLLTSGFTNHVLDTGEPLLLRENLDAERERYGAFVLAGEMPQSSLWVPLMTGGRASGVISLDNFDREHAFDESDQQLLETLAGSLSVALENARLVHETRQRNAELALINSVQDAIAGELEQQAIYDAVGDKLQEIFDAQVVDIAVYEETSGLVHFPYTIERGERLYTDPIALSGFRKHVLQTRAPLMLEEITPEVSERYGNPAFLDGQPSKSALFVPLFGGGKVTGFLSLQNVDRAHAFGESDQQLLETLAGSLSVALENARLVHETRQRNAELGLINSVQDALAGELELQAIYDAVGDQIRDVFDAQVVDIGMHEEATGRIYFPYSIERGVHLPEAPIELMGFRKRVMETRETLRVDENLREVAASYGNPVISGEMPMSVLYVPLVSGGKATGVISLQNIDREHAFTDSDQQLLETLAGSLSVALENARLVHETRQRNAELALINSVQEALAGELEMQAIYDVVGDKIQEIFDAQVVDIGMFDFAAGLTRYPYTIEKGVRYPDEPTPIELSHSNRQVLETKAPVLVNDVPASERERGEAFPVLQGEPALSVLFAPLISGDEVRGRISLQNLDRTNAFTENDVRLLTTLAGSLSVALENARLVHETRQRNAELALISGVQEAIAGELDPQAIYDAVGERIRDVFDAEVLGISMLETATGLLYDRYLIERGERLDEEPWTPSGFSKHVLDTRRPLLVAENVSEAAAKYGSEVVEGSENPKSVLFVPLIVAGTATGVISLQNITREHAFSESDQQLLETLAGSLSVALENARLVHETRQRNAELALINSVQEAIAGELEPQAIYDAVGDRIQRIFDAQVVAIRIHDTATGFVHAPYIVERGERLHEEPTAPMGFSKHVLETRESVLVGENLESEAERYGSPVLSGVAVKSAVFVPLVTAGKATGVISLQNVDREHAFSESDQQLLETLAGSLSVALENARLVHETRQRNAELGVINSVQEAIAGELDAQAIYDAVGDRIRDVFDAQVVSIATVDDAGSLIQYPYLIERGERLQAEPRPLAGFAKHVLETRKPLLITEDLDAESERYGSSVVAGERPKSVLFVPLVAGGKSVGVISLQNIDREHAFDEDDQRLLTTLGGSLTVALENARLVQETRQRVGELATVNSVGQALSSQLDLDALIELVGEQVRQTFDADIAYVALHDEAAGQIEFAYYWESGERRPEAPMTFGEGLTTQILQSREPLLVNRRGQHDELASVGTPSLSYLGVPILLGSRAIGVISVQSIDEEGRFGEADSRLLGTIAANVGVAIQNARLFTEVERQRQYLESLVAITPAAVVVMDTLERVTAWNPAAATRRKRQSAVRSTSSYSARARSTATRGARSRARPLPRAARSGSPSAAAETELWSTSSYWSSHSRPTAPTPASSRSTTT
jgi:GAF domain-containing protein